MTDASGSMARSASDDHELASEYRVSGYVRRRQLVDPQMCAFLARYLLTLSETGRLTEDPQVPGSGSVYGDPAFDVLLGAMTEAIEAHVDGPLLPTYSFARLYQAGGELVRHRDRPACEHSVTLHLGSMGAEWPLWLTDRQGRDVRLLQEPGDALAYLGTELEHWRDPLPAGMHAQVFLHWVRADGPHAEHAFDGRPGLGMPKPPMAPRPTQGVTDDVAAR